MSTEAVGRSAPQSAPRRILLTGSTGFLGRAVAARRRAAGDAVVPLLRKAASEPGLRWDPGSGSLTSDAVSGFDVVIHLAGEPVIGLWTAAKRRRIFDSRVKGTAELARALAGAAVPPQTVLCASGINVYGNRGSDVMEESSPRGEGFLADVCEAWESAAAPLTGVARVLQLRIGVVLAANGGPLASLLPVFASGLGAIVGEGHGYLSWITLRDVLRAMDHLIEGGSLAGPVNLCAPAPVTAEAFSRALGEALHRPVRLRVPGWPFRLLPGRIAEETILGSIRARPAKLLADGFRFEDPELGQALQALHLDRR